MTKWTLNKLKILSPLWFNSETLITSGGKHYGYTEESIIEFLKRFKGLTCCCKQKGKFVCFNCQIINDLYGEIIL